MRIGLVVPRYRQSAVARNKVKRRLRELSRTRLLPADIPVDVVIRIRQGAYLAPFPMLASDIERVLGWLGNWRADETDPSAALDKLADQGPDSDQCGQS
jgi:ribonuclease P protein component